MAQKGREIYIVLDGVIVKTSSAHFGYHLVFSPDSLRFAYTYVLDTNPLKHRLGLVLDGQEVFSLGSAKCRIFFTPDSKHILINVQQYGRHGFIVDGRVHGEFDLIHSDPLFCNDKIMFLAEREGQLLRCMYQAVA